MPTALQTFATNYTAAWCSQNPAAVAAHFSPTGSLTINGSASVGRAAITAAAQSFMSAFPDMQVLMDNLIIHENQDATKDTEDTRATNTGPWSAPTPAPTAPATESASAATKNGASPPNP
jgi:SnoaL-like domain